MSDGQLDTSDVNAAAVKLAQSTVKVTCSYVRVQMPPLTVASPFGSPYLFVNRAAVSFQCHAAEFQ